MKTKVLFVHNYPSKFVESDLHLLQGRYAVSEWYQKSRLVNLPALARAISQSDLVFGWFASWHTFFPILLARMLGKPSLLVVGGYDTANVPEISYGSQRGGIKKWVSRTAMHHSSQLIVNSIATRDEAISNADIDPGRINVIYHGLKSSSSFATVPKENLAVTVGNVDRCNLKRKGLEPFVRAAGLIPEYEFVMIGAWRDDAIESLRMVAPSNVRFTGWVRDEELNKYYLRAAVYVQASRHEGFGLAVAEAMLHQCVPVVTRAGSLPEVVGEAGVYINSTEPREIAEGVRRARAMMETLGPRARERILGEFRLGTREKLLFRTIDAMVGRYA